MTRSSNTRKNVARLNERSVFWVAAGLSVGPLVALGLARFAYALLLPAMRVELHWSYADAGTMNTANAAGYLLGALASPHIAKLYGTRSLFLAGIFGTAAALAGSGVTDNFSRSWCYGLLPVSLVQLPLSLVHRSPRRPARGHRATAWVSSSQSILPARGLASCSQAFGV